MNMKNKIKEVKKLENEMEQFIDKFIEKFAITKIYDYDFYEKYYILNFSLVFCIFKDFNELYKKSEEILNYFKVHWWKFLNKTIKTFNFKLVKDDIFIHYLNNKNEIKIFFKLKVFYNYNSNFCFNVINKAFKEFVKDKLIEILNYEGNIFDNINISQLNKYYFDSNKFINLSEKHKKLVQSINDNIDKIKTILKSCSIYDPNPIYFCFVFSLSNIIPNEIVDIPQSFVNDFRKIFRLFDFKFKKKIKMLLQVFLKLFVEVMHVRIRTNFTIDFSELRNTRKFNIIIAIRVLNEGKIKLEKEKLKEIVFNLIEPYFKEIFKEVFKNYIFAIT